MRTIHPLRRIFFLCAAASPSALTFGVGRNLPSLRSLPEPKQRLFTHRQAQQHSTVKADTHMPTTTTTPMIMEEATVLHRLSDYQRRGWISQIDAAQYRSVMNQRRNDPVTLRQISTRLDEIVIKGTGGGVVNNNADVAGRSKDDHRKAAVASPTYTGSSTSSSSMSGVTSSGSLASTTDPNAASEYEDEDEAEEEAAAPSKPLATNSKNQAESQLASPYLRSLQCISNLADVNSSKGKGGHAKGHPHHHVTWKDDDGGRGTNDNVDNADFVPSGSIVEPSQLWKSSSDSLNPSLLQELFVEMCFYARLGFVQPPCCLKCTYRHAHNPNTSTSNPTTLASCQQFVVWRKNATAVLHPGTLATNIVLVPCADAQKLLDGQVVSGYYWDAAKKRLQVTSPSKKSASTAASSSAKA
jgi:hypothetical protein